MYINNRQKCYQKNGSCCSGHSDQDKILTIIAGNKNKMHYQQQSAPLILSEVEEIGHSFNPICSYGLVEHQFLVQSLHLYIKHNIYLIIGKIMNQKPRRSAIKENLSPPLYNYHKPMSNDVSFSIPDWKQQQILSINQQYQKQIYSAVPLSLTDFDCREPVQFLSPPEKSLDERYAYQRKLLHIEDFSILAFILCLEQILIGDSKSQSERLEKFKKKISDLDLCCLTNVPTKMLSYYDNRILKKILFQYINKGSYNVSLLQILLKRNSVLKFSLSLVSKSILQKRRIISHYSDRIPVYIEMRNCGDQFGVLSTIKVKEKYIETQNFFISIKDETVQVFRKQNIIEIKTDTQKKIDLKRSLTPQAKLSGGFSKQISRKSTKDTRSSKESKNEEESNGQEKDKKGVKRSSSLVNFFRKIICF